MRMEKLCKNIKITFSQGSVLLKMYGCNYANTIRHARHAPPDDTTGHSQLHSASRDLVARVQTICPMKSFSFIATKAARTTIQASPKKGSCRVYICMCGDVCKTILFVQVFN